jgi:hypothetical protein
MKYDLGSAEKVILTGSSAGGMADHLWTNYLKSLLKNPNALYVIPDSSIFLNPSYEKNIRVEEGNSI